MGKRRDARKAEIASLRGRIAVIEDRLFRDKHVHEWRYTKTTTGSGYFYGWKCEDQRCGESGGTNTAAHLPVDFPRDLR